MINKHKRIELRFGLTAPGSMWNLLYEGMEQNINLRTTFKGKDEESIEALIKFGEILKKKKEPKMLEEQIRDSVPCDVETEEDKNEEF